MSETARAEYTPFPSFATWSAAEVSYRDVDRATTRFDQLKTDVSQDVLDKALETARRAAAVDTNAIEGVFATDRGFTRTVAEKAGAWEQAMANRGPHVRPAFDDTLAGFELILDRMTGKRPVTGQFIRELHQTMLRSQPTHTVYVPVEGTLIEQEQALPKGEYKSHANSPTRSDNTVHAYASPDDTAPEMDRLIDELRSESFVNAHPVTQAAYAHYGFVCIHPFADGNGRVARALASVYLYRSPGVPLVIYQDQRARYIEALETADKGHHHSLMRFIAERVTDTVNVIIDELSVPLGASASDQLSSLLAEGALPAEVADAAERLKELLGEALRTRIDVHADKLGLPFLVQGQVFGTPPGIPEWYRAIGDDLATSLTVNTKSPHKLFVIWSALICRRDDDTAEFDLVAVTGTGRQLGVYLRELHPTVSESLRQRVGFFADAMVEEFLARVIEKLRSSGR
ncbi:Fic family protein [Corynebacterium glyciniphilum]|uniref:Fic family protein n=1 Tax=Corynebacterium glyciniphilum TaxID=1404244 RepID=UPI0016423CF7|nr:Fic family protein [Corynebacterium glyciniphilum]